MSLEIEYDEMVINLKVLAQIQINTKLDTRGNFLNIENENIWIPSNIRRWYRRDNRDEAIKKIDRIICKATLYIDQHFSNSQSMISYLKDACIGIHNLKDTYSDCVQTNARLDTILEKIRDYGVFQYSASQHYVSQHINNSKSNDNSKSDDNSKSNDNSKSDDNVEKITSK